MFSTGARLVPYTMVTTLVSVHEDTFTWRKDKTVKMTVQYNYNPALWAGLELYGIILPWIVFIGLILTIILPITGKVTMQPGFTINVIII